MPARAASQHAVMIRVIHHQLRPCRWPVTPCPRPRCTTAAVPRSRHRPRSPGRARRSRTTWCAGRCASRARSGSSAGSASAILARRSQLSRAAAMSRLVDQVAGAHVPAVGGVQLAGGLQMFGDQRGVLVDRSRVTLFDGGGQAPVQFGAIGFQLRFVGHRADQRMAERVLGARGEPHLIDQLRADQLVETRHRPQRGQQVRVEARTDHRRRVQRPLGRRRRAGRCARAMVACRVAGTPTSAISARQT